MAPHRICPCVQTVQPPKAQSLHNHGYDVILGVRLIFAGVRIAVGVHMRYLNCIVKLLASLEEDLQSGKMLVRYLALK